MQLSGSLEETTAAGERGVPELDRLHVFFPEPLKLGRHRLLAVPQSLKVLLAGLRLGNLDPVKDQQTLQTS